MTKTIVKALPIRKTFLPRKPRMAEQVRMHRRTHTLVITAWEGEASPTASSCSDVDVVSVLRC